MFLDSVNYFTISRSLVLLGYFFELLKKDRINVDGKSLWFHTGSIPQRYLCVKQGGPLCPSPKKGTPLLSPQLKQGGYEAVVIMLG